MIVNQQRRISLRLAPLDGFLARVRRELRVPRRAVTVAFVTDAAIHKMNRTYRGKDKPTDVLSFPAFDASTASFGLSRARVRAAREVRRLDAALRVRNSRRPATRRPSRASFSRTSKTSATSTTSYLGDIAIAPAVARRNARRFGRSLDDELRILILHGLLHLLGYDHETDSGQMDRVEARLRRRLGLQ